MARSTTIWVVMDSEDNPLPVAAFTVKHELISWLKRHPGAVRLCRVFRCSDNPAQLSAAVREVPMEALMNGGTE